MFSHVGSSRALRFLSLLAAGLLLMAATPSVAAAQAVTGTLLGTVTDSTGAVVSGAKVTVTNQNTGFTRTVTTDAAGEYTTPSIPTGLYTVLVELTGFKATALSQIAVGVDQRVRIDATLEVGEMTESVTIECRRLKNLQVSSTTTLRVQRCRRDIRSSTCRAIRIGRPPHTREVRSSPTLSTLLMRPATR